VIPGVIRRWAQAILLGWVTLLAIAYGLEGPLLHWIGPLLGASWIATAHLALDCAICAAAGYMTGRFNRSHPVWTAVLFAVTLSFCGFGDTLALNIPFLLRLTWNSLQDSRFFDALLTSAETHTLLLGCLFAGAMLSRPRAKPISVVS
jgi:hypothetical protein